jgi:hypothetical protein
VQKAIVDNGLQPKYFLARKGDVLFWHANLFHGGSPISNPDSSRRALVCHYFAEGCTCYHDYTGTPSHLSKISTEQRPMLSRSEFDRVAYLALNPDVAAAGVDAYSHYEQYGYKEGRRVRAPSPSDGMPSRQQFDAAAYLRFNADVARAGVDPYQHYLEFGHAEGRRTR